jgi:hypothetical protein
MRTFRIARKLAEPLLDLSADCGDVGEPDSLLGAQVLQGGDSPGVNLDDERVALQAITSAAVAIARTRRGIVLMAATVRRATYQALIRRESHRLARQDPCLQA